MILINFQIISSIYYGPVQNEISLSLELHNYGVIHLNSPTEYVVCFAEMCKLKLETLDFSCNRITVIPTVFRFLTTLSDLVLENNPLQSPPAQVTFLAMPPIAPAPHGQRLTVKHILTYCQVPSDTACGRYHVIN